MPKTLTLAVASLGLLLSAATAMGQAQGTSPNEVTRPAEQAPQAEAPQKGPAPLPRIPGVTVPERGEGDQQGFGGGCRYQPRSLELIV